MKKALSMILVVALVLGLLPATVLAEGEQGGTPTLPDGYEQLYFRENRDGQNAYHTTVQANVGASIILQFESSDSGINSITKSGNYVIGCDTELIGTVKWKDDANTFALWDTTGATAGTSGYIYAISPDTSFKYALPVMVTAGSGNQGNNNQSNNPALPGGHQQLYFKGNNGVAATSIQMYANNGGPVALYTDEECTKAVTGDAEVSLIRHALGAVAWNADNGKWIWDTKSANPGESGFLTAEVDGVSYSIYVKVNKAEFGVYTAESINESNLVENYVFQSNGQYTINYKEKGRKAYIIPGGNFGITKVTVTTNEGKVSVARKASGVVEVSVPDAFTGSVTETVMITFGDNFTRNFRFCFTDGTGGNQGGNQENQQGGETLISAEHARTDADTYKGNFVWDASYLNASFKVETDKEYTVYMIPSGLNFEIAHPGGEGSQSYTQNELGKLYPMEQGIGFFLKEGPNVNRITNPELLSAIKEKVGDTLNLQVFATDGPDLGMTNVFPAVYSFADTGTSFRNIRLKVGLNHRGFYIFRASCTVDGNVLTSETRMGWRPTLAYEFTPDLNAEKSPVVQINEFLNGLSYHENASVEIDLPAGEYVGYITVPEKLGRMQVQINGTRENETIETILRGGMETLNFSVYARDIHFIGAGANQTKWANDHVNAGRPNYALYGDANGSGGGSHCSNCVLEGYDVAVSSTGRLRTAKSNLFQNNNIAICYNTQGADGGNSMDLNVFSGNKVGIYFKNLNGDWHAWFVLTGTEFVDNDIDVKNDLKKNIYMPGCYFGDTKEGSVVARECRSDSPNPGGVAKKQVLVYPQAASQTRGRDGKFTEFIYNTASEVYKSNGKKGPMISKNFAAVFPIPEGALAGSTFRIMDPDTNKIIKFTFPAPTGN